MQRSMILFALGFLLCAPNAGQGAEAPSPVLMARGPSASKLVDRGVQYYYEGRYQKALKLLRRALDGGRLDKTRRIGAMQYLAFCQVALGQSKAARNSFNAILDEHPSFRLPAGTAPKIVKLFEVVQAARPKPEVPPDIQHQQPDAGRADKPLALQAAVENMPEGGKLYVHYRHNQASPFSRVEMNPTPAGPYEVRLPPAPIGDSKTVSYYLTLEDGRGQNKGGLGSSADPFQVPLKAQAVAQKKDDKGKDKEEESSTWWIWTIVGTVAVGAAVGVAIALTLPGDSEPAGSATFNFTLVD